MTAATTSSHRHLSSSTSSSSSPSPSTSFSSPPTNSSASDLIQRLKATTLSSPTHEQPTTTTTIMGDLPVLSRPPSNTSEDSASLHQRRPSTPRAQTDPSPESLPTHHTRPRNRSPYSRSHFRSHSGSSLLSAPPMTRAHSLPTVMNPIGQLSLSPLPLPLARPSSPLRSPNRTRSPFRTQEELFVHSGAPRVCDISEDAELELTPKSGGPLVHTTPLSNLHSTLSALPRVSRRRPASPLYQVSVPFGTAVSAPTISTPTSTSSSPMLSATKFNEPFPGMTAHYSPSLTSSSVPSTPTSMRSRSPSISSLETIEDIPDAELEAIEEERIARLKAAADREKDGDDGPRRASLDVPGSARPSFGKRDSRKRWSVCGAERRGDLDLETIWED
ncbi:hypothetical protein K504DRAFT_247257 [Pleomassaria siparia CBS 279.74]|uniref:Basic proline-rich protein n=1 Tax=Pleomassaria siparia CBS 279.74 TaxID=1314801 RepID=A0A6G1KAJ2_9PLEO|nr:hypothetical protein K504DRAFT_247257 [Pleomassaria siparia CBS 279.74]